MSSIYNDYFNTLDKYIEKYGEDTVVFMQVGGFFELYGINNNKTQQFIQITDVCRLLNLIVSKKNKNVPENNIKNPLMAGFPIHAKKKFIDILVKHNYTIVVIEQTTDPPEPKREVTEIISPSTYLDNMLQDYDHNYIMACYMNTVAFTKTKTTASTLSIAVSFMDLSTGESNVLDIRNKNNESFDPNITFDELHRLLLFYRPTEIVFFGTIDEDTKLYTTFINSLNNIDSHIHNRINNFDKELLKVPYQNSVFQKVFSDTGVLSPIEFLDLEREPDIVISYCYLINFAYEHSSKIISYLKKPTIISPETSYKYLRMINNCAEHLNIINSSATSTSISNIASLNRRNKNSKITSMMSLLNNCCTHMGKRYFKQSLLNPITDVKELQSRYNRTQQLIDLKIYKDYRLYLSKMYDMERLFRRMSIEKLALNELELLYTSFECLKEIFKIDKEHNIEFTPGLNKSKVVEIDDLLKNTFNFTIVSKYTINSIGENIFNVGINTDIDAVQEELTQSCQYFIDLQDDLNNIVAINNRKDQNFFKLDVNDKEYVISITRHRFASFQKIWRSSNNDTIVAKRTALIKKYNITENELLSISLTNSAKCPNVKLNNNTIMEKAKKIYDHKENIHNLVFDKYKNFLNFIVKRYQSTFEEIVTAIEVCDYSNTNAYNAIKFNYKCPTINIHKTKDSRSYFQGKGIRHPLIELIQDNTEYITNDVELNTVDSNTGILMYGVNFSGKSSLAKSIGINLIMAQAGMFVACQELTFTPYEYIFVRIPSGDNIFKGHSTYIAEMMELRNILKLANNRSLVIGDELCSSSETTSGAAIVASGIKYLCNKQASFLFASHLHELTNLKDIRQLNQTKQLRICHMHTYYDEKENSLIYERKIKDGEGPTRYGLEVAQSLDMDKDFMLDANKIRNELMEVPDMIVNNKPSRYNTSVMIDTCGICGNKANEVHHIKYQRDADKNGFMKEGFHKNRAFNLISICNKCHDIQHTPHNKEINRYYESTKGIICR
jgi:DNA mismatch repair protein MutS